MSGSVSILGVKYKIKTGNVEQFPVLKDCSGYTDPSVKIIVLSDLSKERECDSPLEDLQAYMRRVARHEIVHAFLHESGLGNNTESTVPWAENEEVVDWIALQAPKLFKAFEEAGCNG